MPSTGASTKRTPAAAARPANSRAPATPTVEHCNQTAPGRIAGSASAITARTASASNSMVSTTSASATAAAAVRATSATPSNAAARAAERFQTVVARPAPATRRAMAEPMIPSPSTATFGVIVMRSRLPTGPARTPRLLP